MNTRIISMVAILLVVASVGVFASSASDLKGSDLVRSGTLGVVTGTLSEEGGEWYLTSTDREYALHLGNVEVAYPKGINLKEGSKAVVRGFVLESDISVLTVATTEGRYSLRTAEGVPVWNGLGARQNMQASQYARSGQGNYRSPASMMQNRQASFQGPSQGMQGRPASYQNPAQAMQGRQASFQSQGQGKRFVQNGHKGWR